MGNRNGNKKHCISKNDEYHQSNCAAFISTMPSSNVSVFFVIYNILRTFASQLFSFALQLLLSDTDFKQWNVLEQVVFHILLVQNVSTCVGCVVVCKCERG